MANILIIGGGGFIGAHLARHLLDNNQSVAIYDFNVQYFSPVSRFAIPALHYRHEKLLAGAELIRGNTGDVNGLRRTFSRVRPNHVVNLAAMPLAITAVDHTEEAFGSILGGTRNVLEILRDIDYVDSFVHISSSMIYGDFTVDPIPEDAAKEPREVYGALKLASEYLVKGYSQLHDIPFSIVRPSAVYGPTDMNRRVIQKFVEAGLCNEPLNVNNPDSTYLDFTFVEDAARGIAAVMATPDAIGEAFNVTRGEARSLGDAVEAIKNHFPDLQVHADSERTLHPKRGALDISKLERITGFRASTSLEQGIARYVEYYRNLEYSA